MPRAHIYTLTLNPALDLSGHVDHLVPNEKNYVHEARLDPGGNGINSGRIARRLGADPVLLGFAGGPSGVQLKNLLDRERLKHRFISIRESTRTNVTVTREDNGQQTRLTFPGPRVRSAEVRALYEQLRHLPRPGVVLLGGSAPQGAPVRFYSQLIRILHTRGLGVGVDVPATLLKSILASRTQKLLLLKPNQTELEQLLNQSLRSYRSVAHEAVRLNRQASVVCVSLGERGAIGAFNGQAWHFSSPEVKVRGTVGAGDSLVGAMTAHLARLGLADPTQLDCAPPHEVVQAIRWGIAAGAATAATEGTSLGSAPLIRKLCDRVTVRELVIKSASKSTRKPHRWGGVR